MKNIWRYQKEDWRREQMTNRNFDEWLSKFRPSISSYDYYIDFEKVIRNVEKIKVEQNLRK